MKNQNTKHNGLGMAGMDAIDLEMEKQADAISKYRLLVGGIRGSRPIAGAGPRTLRVRRSHLRQCVASSSVILANQERRTGLSNDHTLRA